MTDSEEESSQSIQHDLMSVSDQDEGISREDDMRSTEVSGPANVSRETCSSTTASTPSEDSAGIAFDAAVTSVQMNDHASPSQNPTGNSDALELMSKSYSEILLSPCEKLVGSNEGNSEQQPLALLDGTLMREGDMVHFIAKNLESKIKLSSPDLPGDIVFQVPGGGAQVSNTIPSQPNSLIPELTLLSLLEQEARCVASSVDGLTEHLAASLHTISAVTAQSLCVYKDSVCKTCDAMDSNIKSMYQLMAKCEELSNMMIPIYRRAEQVKEIKKLLDLMENLI